MKTPSAAGSRPPRILIVRLSAIGDVIHGLPVLNALRERFPQAMLSWVVEAPAAELLRGHQALDELVTLPKKWLKSPRIVRRLRHRLQGLEPDVAIDLQGLTKSAVAAWLSGAKRRIGFADRNARELSRWFYTERVTSKSQHIIDVYLELLRPLGIESPEVRFEITDHRTHRIAAKEIARQADCQGGFCVINPGAGWPSKRWPPDRYAAVARYLGEDWSLPSMVVWAGDEGRSWAERIVADSEGHARLAPPMSLTELAALSRRARLYLGSDSGPLHLAAAVGTSCVGLYGPWPAERHGPYGPGHAVVQKMVCRGSTRRRRNASSKFMEAIDVDSVCVACDRVLRRDASYAA
ncbi:MAG: glycosyltransferase family 9 protein [Planctomycetota bacterium]